MEPDIGPERLQEWSELIDAGPFSSLCFGERMAFDNPETLTLLGAVGTGRQALHGALYGAGVGRPGAVGQRGPGLGQDPPHDRQRPADS